MTEMQQNNSKMKGNIVNTRGKDTKKENKKQSKKKTTKIQLHTLVKNTEYCAWRWVAVVHCEICIHIFPPVHTIVTHHSDPGPSSVHPPVCQCMPYGSGTMGQFWQVGFSTMSTVSLAPLTCYTHPNGRQSLLSYPNIICGTSTANFSLAGPFQLLFFLSDLS